jgi:hypothetical protein
MRGREFAERLRFSDPKTLEASDAAKTARAFDKEVEFSTTPKRSMSWDIELTCGPRSQERDNPPKPRLSEGDGDRTRRALFLRNSRASLVDDGRRTTLKWDGRVSLPVLSRHSRYERHL